MKILLLSTGGKIGGEETFTRNLALGLMARGHDVEMAVGGDIQRQDVEKAGIKVASVDITGRSARGIMRAAGQVSRYASVNEFDIVHAQAVGPAIMGIMAKKFYGCTIPWIWHNHGITDFAYGFIVRHLNRLDKIVANSDYVSEMLVGHGVKRGQILRIHNGINISDYAATDAERSKAREAVCNEFSIPASHRIITYVGRLSPEKGVEVLLRAFCKLCEDIQDVTCLLIGDGVQKPELVSQIEPYDCKEKVVFAGFRKDIRELVAGSDIFVLPSHIETFSLSTLQAFATGTPCVASDVGGTPEQILHKFNGLLFEDDNADDLSSKLTMLLEDKEMHEYLRQNAAALSRSYLNSDRMIDEIEGLYKQLALK